ncbi:MAG: acyl carrier protein [Motiliproteus sp.]
MNIDTIRHFIKNEILDDPNACVDNDDDLLLTQVLDSLGIMRLVAYIEETWSLEIPAADVTLDNFSSLRQIDAYLACRTEDVQVATS